MLKMLHSVEGNRNKCYLPPSGAGSTAVGVNRGRRTALQFGVEKKLLQTLNAGQLEPSSLNNMYR